MLLPVTGKPPGPHSPQPQAPGPEVRRGSASAQPRWDSGCASAAWPGGGERAHGWGEGSRPAGGGRGAGTRVLGCGAADKGGPIPHVSSAGRGGLALTSRLKASLVFWKQSTNSASEGGRARSVRTPSGRGGGGREPGPPAVAVPGGSGLSLRLPTGSAHLPRSGVTLPPAPAPPRTCRPLLPLLLSLLALVQLLEGLRRFLQPRHEPLNVVQSAVEDLLGPEWGRGQPQAARPSAGTPPPAASWPPGRGRGPECLGRPVRDPPSPSRSSAPARPAAPPPATRGGGGLHRAELQLTGPPPPAPLPPPAPPRGAHLALPAASAGPLGSWWKGSPRRSAGWGWGPGPGPRAGSTAAAGSSPGGP